MLAARSELQPGREDQVDDMVRGQIWLVFSVHHTQWLGYLHMDYLSANGTSTEDGAQLILMAVPYLTVFCIAVLASLTRQAFFLLVTNSSGCFLGALLYGNYRLLMGLDHDQYASQKYVH